MAVCKSTLILAGKYSAFIGDFQKIPAWIREAH
jgi:hypothetical protein